MPGFSRGHRKKEGLWILGVTLIQMTLSVDTTRLSVDDRLSFLVKKSFMPPNDSLPSTEVLTAVARQALLSNSGGKRLRALLLLTAASLDLTTGALTIPSQHLDLACALEIFQTGALVHDDIIDDSDIRRGAPSAHRNLAHLFADFAGPAVSQQTDAAVGSGLGIMLGDLLATLSLRVASTATADTAVHGPMIEAFLQMQHEVEVGQVMDLAESGIPLEDPDAAAHSLTIYRWKTASYTTIAPLELGFLAAGITPDLARTWAESIGTPLGLAFQIADDLIDIVGSTPPSGKPLGGDIREGKRSVLLADALSLATPADRTTLITVFAKPTRNDADIATVSAIFERSGALAKSRDRIDALWDETQHKITTWAADNGFSSHVSASLAEACALFLPEHCCRI